MDSFDKNIKDELSHYDNNIPEGMNWDEMAPGIMDKMPRRRKRLIPIWIFSSIALLGVAIFLITRSHESHKNNDLSSQEKYGISEEIGGNSNENKESLIEKEQNPNVEKAIANVEILDSETTISNNHNSVRNNTGIDTNHDNITKDNLTTERVVDLPRVESTTPFAMDAPENFSAHSINSSNTISPDNSINSVKLVENPILGFIDNTSLLSQVEMNYLVGKMSKINPSNLDLQKVAPVKPEEQLLPLFSVTTGAILWDWAVGEKTAFDISDYESTKASLGIKILADFPFGKIFGLRSGIQYMDLRAEFDHEFVHSKLVRDNSITSPVYNVITRKTSSVSPGYVREIETRKVYQYNHYRALQVPVLVMMRLEENKWKAGIGLGMNIGALLISTGKSIDTNENFVDVRNDAPISRFLGFGIQGDLSLAYSLTSNSSILLTSSYSHSLSNWSSKVGDSRYPSALYLGLGYCRKIHWSR